MGQQWKCNSEISLSIKNKKMSTQKKTEPGHSLADMASEKAAAVKGSVIEGTHKLIAAAEEKYESAKKAIHDMTAPSPVVAPKKRVTEKAAKKE
jgi:hypothetical protein